MYFYFFASKFFIVKNKRKEKYSKHRLFSDESKSMFKIKTGAFYCDWSREIYFWPKMNNSTAPFKHVTLQPSLDIIVVPSALNRYKLLITHSDDLLIYFNFPDREQCGAVMVLKIIKLISGYCVWLYYNLIFK